MSDDGTLLATNGVNGSSTVLLVSDAAPRPIFTANGQLISAVISADASSIFALTRLEDGGRPGIARPFFQVSEVSKDGRSRVLLTWRESVNEIYTSADGSKLLVQTSDQLLLWDRAAGWRSLLSHSEGIASVSASDDFSNFVFSTGQNRLLQLKSLSDELIELYAPLPNMLKQVPAIPVAGSVVRLNGPGFHSSMKLVSQGKSFPVVTIDPAFADFQVPWEFPEEDSAAALNFYEISSPTTPFVYRNRLGPVARVQPDLWTEHAVRLGESYNLLVAAQPDFASRVSFGNPAPAGSTIHAYIGGLGPTDRPLATGAPGPTSPAAKPLAPLTCSISDVESTASARPLSIPFLAYAANLIGVYQIDLDIPADWPTGNAVVECKSDNQIPTRAVIPIVGR